ncbi:uncharacterized protein OCT59_008146 [Rhizophagus irregularis]|uniref:uncharacterized protein n=1 Tax=Rhizophagus irregularis TaxID=588596 RepID=UPI00332EE2C9|nr:hypothetical protein OCT59_008146 [Rhizophagus irregularis]
MKTSIFGIINFLNDSSAGGISSQSIFHSIGMTPPIGSRTYFAKSLAHLNLSAHFKFEFSARLANLPPNESQLSQPSIQRFNFSGQRRHKRS